MSTDQRCAEFAAHVPNLLKLATVLVGPADAEDVVSEAVMRVMMTRRWATVKNPGAFLTGAVVNESRSHRRSEARRRNRETRAARLEAASSWSPSSETSELALLVDELSVRQRSVIYLTYWEDLAVADIAERLGCSDGAVRRHLARARSRLRKVMNETG